jgi:lipoprotein signal peptidase
LISLSAAAPAASSFSSSANWRSMRNSGTAFSRLTECLGQAVFTL